MPCRGDQHLGCGLVRLLRLIELETDDALLLGECPDPHRGGEVAVHGLHPELVVAIGKHEPPLPSELDGLLLPQGSLIAPDLHVVHELGDDHVVALDIGDGVLLGEAACLVAQGHILAGDCRCAVGAFEGEPPVAGATLAVRDHDGDGVDGVEVEGVELLRGDRHAKGLALGGVVDRADGLIVELLRHGEGVAVRVVDGIIVGEAQVFISQVAIDAADGGCAVGSGKCPRPGGRPALAVGDHDLHGMRPKGQFIDRDGNGIYKISRRAERLRRSAIDRLRRR